eukprot:5624826-Pyramimonas_sp.AAC.1
MCIRDSSHSVRSGTVADSDASSQVKKTFHLPLPPYLHAEFGAEAAAEGGYRCAVLYGCAPFFA